MIIFGIDHRGRMRTYDYLSAPPTGWDAPWGQGMRGDMWDAPGGGGRWSSRYPKELITSYICPQ